MCVAQRSREMDGLVLDAYGLCLPERMRGPGCPSRPSSCSLSSPPTWRWGVAAEEAWRRFPRLSLTRCSPLRPPVDPLVTFVSPVKSVVELQRPTLSLRHPYRARSRSPPSSCMAVRAAAPGRLALLHREHIIPRARCHTGLGKRRLAMALAVGEGRPRTRGRTLLTVCLGNSLIPNSLIL
jgi:hypothetical protein